ncbi:MAG: hypothetical protein KA150_11750, partial [Propionivibrio sp.]|nr:hypothetical protein [Propionivibrio sp.]
MRQTSSKQPVTNPPPIIGKVPSAHSSLLALSDFRLQFGFPAADISMTKYVFVTGGVVSSLGKGIAAAS